MRHIDPHRAEPSPTPGAPTTAIAVVLDETGSMQSCRDAAIAGFNEWLAAQRQVEGPCTLTLVQFSDRAGLPMCRLVHEGVPIAEVPRLSRETYSPDGNTPLHDAVGRTIRWMDRLRPRPDRVLMVILTDGEENASREYSLRKVHDLIRAREATGRWTFVYLGANQDAWAASERLGIARRNAAPFTVAAVGDAFGAAADATLAFRASSSGASRDFWRTGRPETAPSTPRPRARKRRPA